ncbi:hypothetical protein M9458_033059, partial [Cirrhinus mrigala]
NGNPLEITLRGNESIIQVSGKYYSGYIYEIMFVTIGQPYGISFNFYPTQDGSELDFGCIDEIKRINLIDETSLEDRVRSIHPHDIEA